MINFTVREDPPVKFSILHACFLVYSTVLGGSEAFAVRAIPPTAIEIFRHRTTDPRVCQVLGRVPQRHTVKPLCIRAQLQTPSIDVGLL